MYSGMLDLIYSEYGYNPEWRNRPLRELEFTIDRILERKGVDKPETTSIDLGRVARQFEK
jgi:hypothetical protein